MMSAKRKTAPSKKPRAKTRKTEYDEEDISSDHESDVEEAETGTAADGEDGADVEEEDNTDVSNIPELPAPEV